MQAWNLTLRKTGQREIHFGGGDTTADIDAAPTELVYVEGGGRQSFYIDGRRVIEVNLDAWWPIKKDKSHGRL